MKNTDPPGHLPSRRRTLRLYTRLHSYDYDGYYDYYYVDLYHITTRPRFVDTEATARHAQTRTGTDEWRRPIVVPRKPSTVDARYATLNASAASEQRAR
ncbi:unnamed protein product [Lampetra planeri]